MRATARDTAQRVQVRLADRDDDASLIALDATAPQPGVNPVYRAHSFFGRADLYENSRVLIASQGGTVAGAAAGAVKPVRWAGGMRNAGHVFNVRVAPAQRRSGVARALLAELHAWFGRENAFAYCLVGERNEASRRLFAAAGYRDITSAAYLVARPSKPTAGGTALVDAAADPQWRRRVIAPSLTRDLCPVNLRDAVYAHPACLGTLVTRSSDASWLSVWDKDTAVGRETVLPSDRSVFLFDLQVRDAPAWRVLIAAVFAQWPWAGRAIVFTAAANAARLSLERDAVLDRREIVMARLPDGLAAATPYLDVRD